MFKVQANLVFIDAANHFLCGGYIKAGRILHVQGTDHMQGPSDWLQLLSLPSRCVQLNRYNKYQVILVKL